MMMTIMMMDDDGDEGDDEDDKGTDLRMDDSCISINLPPPPPSPSLQWGWDQGWKISFLGGFLKAVFVLKSYFLVGF